MTDLTERMWLNYIHSFSHIFMVDIDKISSQSDEKHGIGNRRKFCPYERKENITELYLYPSFLWNIELVSSMLVLI